MSMDPNAPEAVVQRQLDAYNARDLARFVAEYHDDIRIFRLPATEPVISGKAALAEYYATERFNLANLHADIISRIAFGNKVIDHERITGVRAHPFEVAAVYEVVDGRIVRAWFHGAD
jgi:hypothetical protein